MHLEFLVEDQSGKKALEILFQKLLIPPGILLVFILIGESAKFHQILLRRLMREKEFFWINCLDYFPDMAKPMQSKQT